MAVTLGTFTSVQLDIWDMLTSARDSCTDNEQRRRLHFLRNITPPIWMTFGVCWHLEYFGLISIYHAEVVVIWGNFVSKVYASRNTLPADLPKLSLLFFFPEQDLLLAQWCNILHSLLQSLCPTHPIHF